jgi:predicted metal-binding transcription factor (methanogenesis marker protein 9)
MSPTTELLTSEIYPRLFENLQSALPEFDFKRLPNKGYVSTNEVKITGEAGKKGKVYCYEDNISRLFDYTRAKVTIWDYVKNRDGLSQAETLKRLAELAEYTLSNDSLSAESIESIAKANHRAQIWEDANSFFIHCLNHKENAFSETQGANQIRNYLVNDRGYKPHLFLAPDARQDQANPKSKWAMFPLFVTSCCT